MIGKQTNKEVAQQIANDIVKEIDNGFYHGDIKTVYFISVEDAREIRSDVIRLKLFIKENL